MENLTAQKTSSKEDPNRIATTHAKFLAFHQTLCASHTNEAMETWMELGNLVYDVADELDLDFSELVKIVLDEFDLGTIHDLVVKLDSDLQNVEILDAFREQIFVVFEGYGSIWPELGAGSGDYGEDRSKYNFACCDVIGAVLVWKQVAPDLRRCCD